MRVVKTTIMPILTIVCLLSHNVTKSSWKNKLVENGSSFLAIGCGAVALGVKLMQDGAYGERNSINSAVCGTTRNAYETGFNDVKVVSRDSDETFKKLFSKKFDETTKEYKAITEDLNAGENRSIGDAKDLLLEKVTKMYETTSSSNKALKLKIEALNVRFKAVKKKDNDLIPGLTEDYGKQGKNAGIKIGFGGGFVSAGLLTIGYGIYKLLCKKPSE